MTAPRRRPRTGIRRDGQVRTIRSDAVRYPGCNHPALDPVDYASWRDSGRPLRPARDAGIAVESRLTRERRLREREKRRRTSSMIVTAVALAVLALGWRYTSDRTAALEPLEADSPAARRASAPGRGSALIRGASTPAAPATPIFASYKSIDLRLPVPLEDLTEVGFHQASYSYARHLKSAMPAADMKAAKKNKGTGRDLSLQESGKDAKLTGTSLVMWRSRPGKPDTAVDVGAKAGSPVLAPVTGTVVKVKRYKLYGQHDDYELHIQPEGRPDLDVVMIHIDGLTVKAGDPVVAGLTHIGVIRKLSDRVDHQLGDYTKDGGDHTHVQINDATHPDYKGLKGAVAVADGS